MTLMDTAVFARNIWFLYCKSCSGATVIKREVAPMISHRSFEMTAVRHRRFPITAWQRDVPGQT